MIITKEVETLPDPKLPLSDKKNIKLIKLQNGLKAVLLNHPKIVQTVEESESVEKSAAVAICVDVGSFEDPKEVQGLSHFLEHMVIIL